jgi:hypothetical protein
MVRMMAVLVMALVAAAPVVLAQERETERAATGREPLPPEVLREISDLYNAAGTLRVAGSLTVGPERTVTGDIAITGGPTLLVSGRITGRVLAINTDVVLRPGATIDGDVLIVGGRLEGRETATIGGGVRVYRQPLSFRMEGERLVPDQRVDRDFGRLGTIFGFGARTASHLSITVTPYNRVEGLPVRIGPTLAHHSRDVDYSIDLLGIIRSVDSFKWTSENVGHHVMTDARMNRRRGIGIGGALFDVVEPVEGWTLKDTEAGLAAFFLHRDYRDHYERHGGSVYLAGFSGEERELRIGFRDERWRSREQRDPFSLTRDNQPWRPNPEVDEGRMRLLTASYRLDTRNDEDDPWTGWLLTGDVERGSGDLVPAGSFSPAAQSVTYVRGFADLRRYNRLSPDAQLNMRLVIGGWLGGDDLPIQRRLSVGGPGSLPGYDFRRHPSGADVATCQPGGASPGLAALCERIVVTQIEYRGALRFGRLGFREGSQWWADRGLKSPQWVAFADAGRGWRVGDREGELQYPGKTLLPPLETFRTDVGLGLDARVIGFFVAKAVSHPDEPLNFFVRVRHRF